MAFNFLGTMSIIQLQELKSFLDAQIEDIDEQINYLRTERDSLERTFTALATADQALGGSAQERIFDIKLPDIVRVPKQDDSSAAVIIEQVKKPFIETIKHKHERNEYKLKKLYDAIEQTSEMIDRKGIAKSQTLLLLNELESKFTIENSAFLFKTEEERINYMQGIFTT